MTEKRRCPECGAHVADDVDGACPVCALREALNSGIEESPNDHDFKGPFADLYQSQAETAPRRFGDYEILEEIARGGMGVVYRARQLSLNRTVAIKMILAGSFATEAEVKRFHAEAEAIARLHHPNIVAIHEVGLHEGHHFFSMDFVAGEDLGALVRNGPLPAAKAAQYLQTVAAAIHYAHQEGVLHRDLKPSNVLLDGHGEPRVTDFGLAKQIGSNVDLTLSGQVLGSPNFMPPEQAAGRKHEVGPPSDVYSLGAILYHLLSGRPPFLAESLQATLTQVINSAPLSLRTLNEHVPSDLETICLKCLEKSPSHRYQTARELADELGRFLRGEPILARPIGRFAKGWRWCRRNPALAASLTAAALLLVTIAVVSTVAAWRIASARDDEKVQRLRAQTNEVEDREHLVRLKVAAGWQMVEQGQWFDALAPFADALELDQGDSRREEPHQTRIAMLLQNGPQLERMWFPGGPLTHLELSPDGKRVLTATASWQGRTNQAAAQIWDLQTGTPLTPPLFHTGRINVAAFSPDGTRVITASEDGTAQVWDAATGAAVGTRLRHFTGVTSAGFSPDGQWVATGAPSGHSDTNGYVYVWNSRNGACQFTNIEYGRDIQMIRFTPDSKQLLVGAYSFHCVLFDFITKTNDDYVPDCWRAYAADYSHEGNEVLVAGAFGHIFQPGARLFDSHTWKALTPLLQHADGAACAAAFSPDGRMLATGGTDQTARLWDASTGEAIVSPLKHTGPVTSVEFSPDGRKLLTASRDGTARIWDTDSGLPDCPPLKQGGPVCQALFSSNGREVVTGCEDGAVRIWNVTPASAQRLVLDDGEVRCARFSPDGRWIATGDSGGMLRIWDAATLKPVFAPLPHTGWIESVKFSRNGHRMLVHCENWVAQIWDFSGDQPKPLGMNPSAKSADFDPEGAEAVSTDGHSSAQLWDAKTGTLIRTNFRSHVPNAPYETTDLVRFSPDGYWIGLAQISGKVEVWDTATLKRLPLALAHESPINNLSFSQDSRRVVTVSDDDTARIWGRESGLPASPPLLHAAPVKSAAFSPDGHLVVTASDDGTARLWTCPAGNPVGRPMLHHAAVNEACFSPDGLRVATASSDGTARVWDTETGEALTPPLVHAGKVWTVDFSPDGRWLLTASEDQSVRLWRLPENLPELAEVQWQVRVFAGTSIEGTNPVSLPQAWSNLISGRAPARGVDSLSPQTDSANSQSGASSPLHPFPDIPNSLTALQLAEQQGDFAKSIRLLNHLNELCPGNWLLLFRQAYVEARLTDFADAIADYTKALQIRPDASICWLGRYLARSSQGDKDATSDLRETLKYAGGFRARGFIARIPQGTPADPSLPNQWEMIACDCTALLKIYPQNLDLLCACGVAEAAQFRWTTASKDFELAAEMRPSQPETWLALALTYSKLAERNDNMWPQVLAASQHALACEPNDPMAQSLRAEALHPPKPQ